MKSFTEYFGEAFEPKRIAEREQEFLHSVKGKVESAHAKLKMWLEADEEKKELKYLLTNYVDKARLLSDKAKVEHIPLFEKIVDLTKLHEFRELREVHDLVREAKKLRDEKRYTLELNKKYYDSKDEKAEFLTGDDKNVTFYFHKSDGEAHIFYPSKWKTNSKVEGRYSIEDDKIIITFKALEKIFDQIMLNIKKDNRVTIKNMSDFSYTID